MHINTGLFCATPPACILKMFLSLKLRKDWPFNYCAFVVLGAVCHLKKGIEWKIILNLEYIFSIFSGLQQDGVAQMLLD